MDVRGGDLRQQALVRGALARLPAWYVEAAQVSEVVLSAAPEVRAQVACYRHGSRDVLVAPGVGGLLLRALAHEFAHACDDRGLAGGGPHEYSLAPGWMAAHRATATFELAKYRDDPRESFADAVAKVLLLGHPRFARAWPEAAPYVGWVLGCLEAYPRGTGGR